MRTALLTLALIACSGDDTSVDVDTADVDTADADTADIDTDSGTDVPDQDSDEALARALIAGHGSVDAVLQAVADSGGWPVPTDDGTVLFVVPDPGFPAQLTGDHNDWQPEPMTAGDGLYWAEVTVAEPAGSAYKITDDDALFVPDRWARHYAYDTFGEKSLVAAPSEGAHYARYINVSHAGLAPRDVRVRVPASGSPWPVLYVQDGQNLFETGGPFGSWHLETNTQAESMLLVGIDNTPARVDELTHVIDTALGSASTPMADDYAALVRDVVRARVEADYATSGVNGVMGSSLGGLVSLYMAQLDPDAWDFAASLSGTLGWGRFDSEGPVVEELYLGRTDLGDLVIYVDSGGSDGGDGCTDPNGDGFPADDPNDTDNFCMNRHFADALADDGFVFDETLFHWHEAGASHSEAAWAARVFRPLDRFLALTDDAR